MRLYTSYYAKLKRLPNDIFPISISITKPKGIIIPTYFNLNPSKLILMKYKMTGNEEEYKTLYTKEILSKNSPQKILNDLKELSGGKDVCLMCWEKPSNFCHRHIVSKWFQEHGIPCSEYSYDQGEEVRGV